MNDLIDFVRQYSNSKVEDIAALWYCKKNRIRLSVEDLDNIETIMKQLKGDIFVPPSLIPKEEGIVTVPNSKGWTDEKRKEMSERSKEYWRKKKEEREMLNKTLESNIVPTVEETVVPVIVEENGV